MRRVLWADDPLPAGCRVLLRLQLQRQSLDPSTVATCRTLAARPHPGYDLVRWRDRAPDALAAPFGRVMGHVLDAPGAALQLAPRDWDAAAVRAWESTMDGALLVTGAVHDGTLVAATVALVPLVPATVALVPLVPATVAAGAPPPSEAEQHDTAVLPEHRGHGLATWIKAAQTLTLHEAFPSVRTVSVTVNQDNSPMLAVNHALGYRDVRGRLLVEEA